MDAHRTITVAISGSHGLIGSHLAKSLRSTGHAVRPMVRGNGGEPDKNQIGWNPSTGTVDLDRLAGVDAVVHLAGEPLMGLWTDQKKRRIERSRAEGTHAVAQAIASLPMDDRPGVMICASAIGYYGNTGEHLVDERGEMGGDFLAAVCRQWEEAAEPARQVGVRVVHPRLGMVLAPDGGALALMARVFRLGLGGCLGSGHQWVSWVAIDDVVGVIQAALFDDAMRGPVNVVAPRPIRHRAFIKTLGHVLHRPTFLPIPAWLARLALGELADQILLHSARIQPATLHAIGYAHRCPELEPTLDHMLRRDAKAKR